MKRVVFPLQEASTIIYPDDISFFSNTEIVGTHIIAYYNGALQLQEYKKIQLTITATEITPNTSNTELAQQIITTIGTEITFNANITMGSFTLNVNQSFALPLQKIATTGEVVNEKYLAVQVANGEGTKTVAFTEEGRWVLSETQINSRLPANMHMNYGGLEIFVGI